MGAQNLYSRWFKSTVNPYDVLVRFCNQCNQWFEDRDFASDSHFTRHIGAGIDGTRGTNSNRSDSNAGAALLVIALFYIIRPIYRTFTNFVQRRWPNIFLYHRQGRLRTIIAFIVSIYLAINVISFLALIAS